MCVLTYLLAGSYMAAAGNPAMGAPTAVPIINPSGPGGEQKAMQAEGREY